MKNEASSLVVLGLVWLTTAVGCGGGGGKAKTTDDFCNEKVAAECQAVTTKCVSDFDACVAGRLPLCHEFVSEATASGSRLFVPGNIGSCVSKTKSVYGKNGAITPAELTSLDDACNYVFQGNAAMDGACTVKYDCADKSLICDKGLCAKQVNKNKGDLCGNPGEVCKAGSFCQLMTTTTAVTYRCAEKAAENATCSEDIPCKEEFRCSLGSCTDRAGNSGSCSSDDDCATSAPYCDPYVGGKCDPGLVFGSGSSSCTGFTNPMTGAGGHGGGAGGHGGGAGGRGGAGGTGTGGGTAGAGGSTGAAGTGTAGSGPGGTGGGTTDAGTDV